MSPAPWNFRLPFAAPVWLERNRRLFWDEVCARWERELGLLVHRVRSASGQTVYAVRQELDEWLARAERDARRHTRRWRQPGGSTIR
jgi:hypothetical protein